MAPYSGANQYVDVQKSFGTGTPQNWTGKTLHVRIRATRGHASRAARRSTRSRPAASSSAARTPTSAQNTNWQEFTVDLDNPMVTARTPVPATTRRRSSSFGVQLNTGTSGAGATPVTFNIDSFSFDPPIAGATGTAGAGGGGARAAPDQRHRRQRRRVGRQLAGKRSSIRLAPRSGERVRERATALTLYFFLPFAGALGAFLLVEERRHPGQRRVPVDRHLVGRPGLDVVDEALLRRAAGEARRLPCRDPQARVRPARQDARAAAAGTSGSPGAHQKRWCGFSSGRSP